MRFDYLSWWCRPLQRRGAKRALVLGAVMTSVVSATCYVTCVAGGPLDGQFRPRPTARASVWDTSESTFSRDVFQLERSVRQVNPFYAEPGRAESLISPADYIQTGVESQPIARTNHEPAGAEPGNSRYSSTSISDFIRTSPLSVPVRPRNLVASPIRQPEAPPAGETLPDAELPHDDVATQQSENETAGETGPWVRSFEEPQPQSSEPVTNGAEGSYPADEQGYFDDAAASREEHVRTDAESAPPQRVVVRSTAPDRPGAEEQQDRLTRLPQDDAVNVGFEHESGQEQEIPEIHVAELGVTEEFVEQPSSEESVPSGGQVRAHLHAAGAVANVNDRVVDGDVVAVGKPTEYNTASLKASAQDPYMMGPQAQAPAYPGGSELMWSQDCGGCPDSYYVHAEYLYFDREGRENISLSTAFVLEDFDFQSGGRLTAGRRFDCLNGWELSYVGHFDWDEFQQAAGGPFNLTLGVLPGVNVTSFNNAVLHRQEYSSELDSFELLRRRWGWDVISVSQGFRYVRVEEDFRLTSINGAGDVGVLRSKTENNFAGYQMGIDLFYPTGNLTLAGKLKGGLYANFVDQSFSLTNAGVGFQNSGDSVEFGSLVETGLHSIYHITDTLSLRGGYEIWWLYGVATAPQQPGGALSPFTGREVDADESVFYHGASVGVELVW